MRKQLWIPLVLFLFIYSLSIMIQEESITIALTEKNESPSWSHLFGTDWLGRDMFLRTLEGIQLSVTIGFVTALLSTTLGFFLSFIASIHSVLDHIVSWLIDLFLSLPHLITLILISFVLGGGFRGVVIGLMLTHWPVITRVLRAEWLQIQEMPYVQMSKQLGKGFWWRTKHHFLPHLLPQMMVGFTLIFPHAILHEAAITFLGFGLSAEEPAIGVILSESMQYLSSGMWWLAFFPGVTLLVMVVLFQWFANTWKHYIERDRSYETYFNN
ncbi:binding-protein-dependent transport system inner membrane protein [Gracilibacillus halophilus YIM-C55.5]|uniref:Binding-protein-dependent transport system inner membrane protein n=1 Tax=Gracilibacillus halophilus YIM-C55.5 TaxID=1308866 RepID=N4WBL6_9BACI|nr:ABC transporter permease [Gracilibacillus halophilus]ENH96639.1 binding-protein-dependent transport system inner membrane protein [Gracilibacillus halophilus YIM-C55.5]